MDEAPEDALKYLSIIARTQNESTEFYPVSWTHTFLDIKVNNIVSPFIRILRAEKRETVFFVWGWRKEEPIGMAEVDENLDPPKMFSEYVRKG